MTTASGMTAFVPNGESRKDTATLLLGAALDNGLDETRAVVAVQDGFYISDELADALGGEGEHDVDEPDSDNPEVDKAEDQIDAEHREPPLDGAEVVDAAIDPEPEAKPEPKAKATKKTSGNRAAKNATEQE